MSLVKQFDGWAYYSTEEPKPKKRGRPKKLTDDADWYLKRESDGVELRVGDVILVIEDTSNFPALLVSIQYSGPKPELQIVRFKYKLDLKSEPEDRHDREVFLTLSESTILLEQFKEKLNVLNEENFEELGDLEQNHSFFCQRVSNNDSGQLSNSFNYDTIKPLAKNGPKALLKFLVNELRDDHSQEGTDTRKLPPRRARAKKVLDIDESEKESDLSSDDSNDSDGFHSALEAVSDAEESPLDGQSVSRKSSPKKNTSRNTSRVSTPRKPRKAKEVSTPTPRKRKRKQEADDIIDSEDLESPGLKTPKTDKKKEYNESMKFMQKILGTSKRIRILHSLPVPNLPSFSPKKKTKLTEDDYEGLDTSSTAFKELKKKLHTSTKLASLPCREDEFTSLYLSIENAIREQAGCCLYLSGTPGIGKTATIREVMHEMRELQSSGDLNDFQYIEINALKLIDPNYAYATLWSKISGVDVSPSNAALFLEAYFKDDSETKKPIVVMVDELDQIANKKQNVMYNFFNWPTYANSKLVVIAVANTMDLPERVLSTKISSRMGLKRIQFIGYTFEQLGTIIEHRLDMLTRQSKHKVVVDRDAINFASRKVASVSGDARRALQICRRAVEIAELEHKTKAKSLGDPDDTFHVRIPHIAKAINETVSSPLAQYISSLALGSKLILCALLLRMRRSGLSENPLGDIIDEIKVLLKMASSRHLLLHNMKAPIDMTSALLDDALIVPDKLKSTGASHLRIDSFRFLVFELVENGILNAQDIKSERYKLISLNISQDEVMTTLKNDPQVSGFL